jgi:hypothetical protein
MFRMIDADSPQYRNTGLEKTEGTIGSSQDRAPCRTAGDEPAKNSRASTPPDVQRHRHTASVLDPDRRRRKRCEA